MSRDDPIAHQIRAVRNHFGFSRRELARVIGVRASSVQAWEQGRRPPGCKTMAILEPLLEEADAEAEMPANEDDLRLAKMESRVDGNGNPLI